MLELIVKADIVHPLEHLILGGALADGSMASLAFESHGGSMPVAEQEFVPSHPNIGTTAKAQR
ncbi:hypothetical protein GCM10023145_38920 [Angustibacter luteus]